MRRHDLVYLHTTAAFTSACAAEGSGLADEVAAWIALGRPLVMARQPVGPGVQLGLTLPLRLGRQRLAIQVVREDIAAVLPPVRIQRCLERLPGPSATAMADLATAVAGCGAAIGIFGSLAWEVLTGEDYRNAESDIDIICDVTTSAQLKAVMAALGEAAGHLYCRLDGEVRMPDGLAVSWRELAGLSTKPDARLLVKGPELVGLMSFAELTVSLQAEVMHA
jgi:phosphoribosyl-dephospho-CoA transferase